jgi:UDP:flavonoid glycosyltransferase YjiC (YdhE family)
MAILGVFCFPGTGHINPFTALARRLQQRGHRVIVFGIADTEARVRAAGVEFCQVGAQDYPLGTLAELDRKLSTLKGLSSFRFTVDRVKNHSHMELRDGPAAVKAAGVEAMLVDEADMAGSVADMLGLPFISIACFPPLMLNDSIPPFVFGWRYHAGPLARLRNLLGRLLLTWVAQPIYKEVNAQRTSWGLAPFKATVDALSPLAQITQLPQALEFPMPNPPLGLHYTGPFVDQVREPVAFPWGRLNGKPLVYASMGTLQNGAEWMFRTIAEACAGRDVQLVLSMGGSREPSELGELPGTPIVVRYAPQLELLRRAAVVVTHAGLNTTLESLAEGVPLVAIPMGNDQPGVAARIAYAGVGVVIPPKKLSRERLQRAIGAVLQDEKYRSAAQRVQAAIRDANGLEKAADVIELALQLRVAA